MNEYDEITHNNLPEAVMQLMKDLAYIKNHLLNQAATTAAPEITAPEKELLTVADVSQMLDIASGTIYNMTSTQQIPFFKRGGRIYFDREEINEWIRNDRRKTVKQLQVEAEVELNQKNNK